MKTFKYRQSSEFAGSHHHTSDLTQEMLADYEWEADVYLRRVLSSGTQHHVVSLKSTDVSEEHVASIFKVEEIIQARKQSEADSKSISELPDVQICG
jgi:hypothetical protein